MSERKSEKYTRKFGEETLREETIWVDLRAAGRKILRHMLDSRMLRTRAGWMWWIKIDVMSDYQRMNDQSYKKILLV
jgi:hypothetical protein